MVEITYFVNGTTIDNETDKATGILPGELSALGVEQSKKLPELVKDKKFDVVFCSDLKLAVDSAELAFGNTYPIIQDERTREADYGDWNGGPHSFKDNMADYVNHSFPNGGSYKDVEMSMRSFCDYLKAGYDGKHVAIVAHQAPQLTLDVILRGRTWEQAIAEDWRKQKAWQPGWEYVTK